MYKAQTNSWYLERVVFLLAGVFTLLSTTLAVFFQNPNWLYLAVLVGVNLVIFSVTGFCVMAIILTKLGFKSSCKPSN